MNERRDDMASLDMKKYTTAGACGLKIHLDDKERMTHTHSNTDIDVNKTNENYWIGCENYQDMINSWSARQINADREHPPGRIRKDRITAVMVECKCPWEIANQGKEYNFFNDFYGFMIKKLGAENVHGLTVHVDEVHDYEEHGQIKTSMIHAHMMITPYAYWQDSKGIAHEGINGKHFLTREMLRELQKEFNELCLEKYGIEYQTHGEPKHRSVEDLKREGQAQQIIKQREALENKASELAGAVIDKQKELNELNDDYDEIVQSRFKLTAEAQNLEKRINELKNDKNAKMGEIQALEERADELKAQQEHIEIMRKLEDVAKKAKKPDIKPNKLTQGVTVIDKQENVELAYKALEVMAELDRRYHRALRAEKQADKIIKKAKAEADKMIEDAMRQKLDLQQQFATMELTNLKKDLQQAIPDYKEQIRSYKRSFEPTREHRAHDEIER